MRNVVHTGREAQPRLELTGIAPNSRQQSKTVNIKAHIRNEQSCIDEFEVVFVDKTEQTERESMIYGY